MNEYARLSEAVAHKLEPYISDPATLSTLAAGIYDIIESADRLRSTGIPEFLNASDASTLDDSLFDLISEYEHIEKHASEPIEILRGASNWIHKIHILPDAN